MEVAAAVDDVAIGKDEPVRGDDEAGAVAAAFMDLAAMADGFADLNKNDRGPHGLHRRNDRIGIRIQQRPVVQGRRRPRGRWRSGAQFRIEPGDGGARLLDLGEKFNIWI